MIAPRHFDNPPIKEAVFDLRIKPLDPDAVVQLGSPPEEFLEQYPNKSDHKQFSGEAKIDFEVGQISGRDFTKSHTGYVYKSSDNLEIVQFRLDGFTVNRLAPYTSWDDFRDKAMRALAVYELLAKPQTYTRAALRYINRINMSSHEFDTDEYFSCPPKIPPNIPQSITNFLTQVQILDKANGLRANLIQTIPRDKKGEFPTWLIDIDVFSEFSCKPNEPKLAETFELIHTLKNEIFFGCLEEKILEIIK